MLLLPNLMKQSLVNSIFPGPVTEHMLFPSYLVPHQDLSFLYSPPVPDVHGDLHWWWASIFSGSDEPLHRGLDSPCSASGYAAVSQGQMCGYVAQVLCFCSTQIDPICPHTPQPHKPSVGDSFTAYLKLFPNSNSSMLSVLGWPWPLTLDHC